VTCVQVLNCKTGDRTLLAQKTFFSQFVRQQEPGADPSLPLLKVKDWPQVRAG
jgi:hypothetical protein